MKDNFLIFFPCCQSINHSSVLADNTLEESDVNQFTFLLAISLEAEVIEFRNKRGFGVTGSS